MLRLPCLSNQIWTVPCITGNTDRHFSIARHLKPRPRGSVLVGDIEGDRPVAPAMLTRTPVRVGYQPINSPHHRSAGRHRIRHGSARHRGAHRSGSVSRCTEPARGYSGCSRRGARRPTAAVLGLGRLDAPAFRLGRFGVLHLRRPAPLHRHDRDSRRPADCRPRRTPHDPPRSTPGPVPATLTT